MQTALKQPSPGWQAQLRLGFRKTPNKTVLAERFRQGPLSVQRTLYPEQDLCHVYLLHPPGGVVGGDTLEIHVDVAEHASALVTTPGAGKFYRSCGPCARQQQQLTLSGGSLEWFPQENILFPGAEVTLSTQVRLDGKARFIGWEINCLGRPAVNERFDYGQAVFRFELTRDDRPVLLERLEVQGETGLTGSAGLRGHPVIGSLYATLDDPSLLDTIRGDKLVAQSHNLGITIIDGVMITRYLGDSTEQARGLFKRIWLSLRPAVLNRPACEPRVWNT